MALEASFSLLNEHIDFPTIVCMKRNALDVPSSSLLHHGMMVLWKRASLFGHFSPVLRISLLSWCIFQALPQKRCKGRNVDGQPLSRVGIFDGSAKQFAILAHPDVYQEREISTGCQRLRVRRVFTQLVSPFPAWQTRAVSPPPFTFLILLTPYVPILAYPAQFSLNIYLMRT
jgi:hypothetical protein